MTDQLGFHNLPFLAHRKSVKRGFEFTLMVVGERVCYKCYVSAYWLCLPIFQASLDWESRL